MLKPMVMRPCDPKAAYPYTVVSRDRDERGHPVDGRHTLWESCRNEEMAMAYARQRAKEGRWVDVFRNVAESVSDV
jgi:hypothetical protein